HKLIGKTGHGASDANSTDIGTAADSVDPSALSDIALYYRSPTPQFYNARWRAIFFGELALFVVASSITTIMDRVSKQPSGTQAIIKRDHRCLTRSLPEQIKQRLHHVIRLYRASRNTDDGDIGFRFPIFTEILRQSHTSGGIAFHSMNPAIRRAGTRCYDRPGAGGELVDPVARQNRLSASSVSPERSPITLFFVLFVRYRPLYNEDERSKFAVSRQMKRSKKVLADFIGKKGIVEPDLWNTGNASEKNVFDAGLRGRCHRDRIAVTSQTGGDPQNIDLRKGGAFRRPSDIRLAILAVDQRDCLLAFIDWKGAIERLA